MQLERGGFLQRVGIERIFPTLPTALEGYRAWVREQDAARAAGAAARLEADADGEPRDDPAVVADADRAP